MEIICIQYVSAYSRFSQREFMEGNFEESSFSVLQKAPTLSMLRKRVAVEKIFKQFNMYRNIIND